MTKRRTRRRDSMDRELESALQPGRYIGWAEGSGFVSGLRHVEQEIARLVVSEAARAAELYETFIAACTQKADEVDDSDAEFGMFVGDLYCGWIKARQAAGADGEETARLLLAWMDDDPYGFCNDLEHHAAKVMDKAGLAAFESVVLARLDATPEESGLTRRLTGMLKAIYLRQRNVQKYLALVTRTEPTRSDCGAIAAMFQAKRKPKDALTWVERGLRTSKTNGFETRPGYNLAEMRRVLLLKLGRGEDALQSVWDEFQAHPSKSTYENLVRYVPKAERRAWHEKAMAATGQGSLASLIELWLGTKEIGRLVERLQRAGNADLENLSHYATEPAAKHLASTHPEVAAKVFRALCMRILKARKSNYYYAALSHLEQARNCYQKAGLDAEWRAVVAEIRQEHHRKSGFMPGFERIVRGSGPRREPSFLDTARRRWGRSRVRLD